MLLSLKKAFIFKSNEDELVMSLLTPSDRRKSPTCNPIFSDVMEEKKMKLFSLLMATKPTTTHPNRWVSKFGNQLLAQSAHSEATHTVVCWSGSKATALSWTYVLIIELYRHNKIASLASATTQHPLTMFWQMFSTRTTKAFSCLKSQTRTSRFAFSNKTFFFCICFLNSRRVFFFVLFNQFFSSSLAWNSPQLFQWCDWN